MKNIDALTYNELLRLAYKIYINRDRMSRKLFPEQPEGHLKALSGIQSYAFIAALAQRLRKDGDIAKALKYEAMANKFYADLPDFAKW